ncbi:MAG TPA: hypothetical protein VFW00_13110 [Rhodocyclaceae bacterium]|nr:hypothetical protein [Rhodocyclaceae bacterium]
MMSLYDRSADVLRTIYVKRIAAPAVLDTQTYFPEAHRFTDARQDIRRRHMPADIDLLSSVLIGRVGMSVRAQQLLAGNRP